MSEQTLQEKLRIKAGMIDNGERIEFRSDSYLMIWAADEIDKLNREVNILIESINSKKKNFDKSARNNEEMIERWRFDKLRNTITVALQISGDLLRQREEGNWLDSFDEYHKTVALIEALATGLRDGTGA